MPRKVLTAPAAAEGFRVARDWLTQPGLRNLVREGYVIVYRVDQDTGNSATAGDVMVLAVFPPGIGSRVLA